MSTAILPDDSVVVRLPAQTIHIDATGRAIHLRATSTRRELGGAILASYPLGAAERLRLVRGPEGVQLFLDLRSGDDLDLGISPSTEVAMLTARVIADLTRCKIEVTQGMVAHLPGPDDYEDEAALLRGEGAFGPEDTLEGEDAPPKRLRMTIPKKAPPVERAQGGTVVMQSASPTPQLGKGGTLVMQAVDEKKPRRSFDPPGTAPRGAGNTVVMQHDEAPTEPPGSARRSEGATMIMRDELTGAPTPPKPKPKAPPAAKILSGRVGFSAAMDVRDLLPKPRQIASHETMQFELGGDDDPSEDDPAGLGVFAGLIEASQIAAARSVSFDDDDRPYHDKETRVAAPSSVEADARRDPAARSTSWSPPPVAPSRGVTTARTKAVLELARLAAELLPSADREPPEGPQGRSPSRARREPGTRPGFSTGRRYGN